MQTDRRTDGPACPCVNRAVCRYCTSKHVAFFWRLAAFWLWRSHCNHETSTSEYDVNVTSVVGGQSCGCVIRASSLVSEVCRKTQVLRCRRKASLWSGAELLIS